MNNQQKQSTEPRDKFSLNIILWIQEILASDPKVKSNVEQEKEYFRLLETPLETFEK